MLAHIIVVLAYNLQAGSCNVTGELDRLTVDLVQLYVSEERDVLCLQNLVSPIGALATNRWHSNSTQIFQAQTASTSCLPYSAREGLVVDYVRNSSVLFLVPLTVWENLDSNTSMFVRFCINTLAP